MLIAMLLVLCSSWAAISSSARGCAWRVEEREDSPLELAQDARGRGRRSDAFDEDPGRAVPC